VLTTYMAKQHRHSAGFRPRSVTFCVIFDKESLSCEEEEESIWCRTVTRERGWWQAGRQSQPRWSVAHVHLNYISSAVKRCGKTTALPAEERGEDSHREIERERELCDPFLLEFSRASNCYKSRMRLSTLYLSASPPPYPLFLFINPRYLVTNLFSRVYVAIKDDGSFQMALLYIWPVLLSFQYPSCPFCLQRRVSFSSSTLLQDPPLVI
jgi:hypothetical protein